MKDLIAYCGLDCEKCDARKATLENDNELRERTAKLWSELNQTEITTEMINCTGCRTDGVKTPYCSSICPIRKCASDKGLNTCGECPEMEVCSDVGMIIGNNEDARNNLK
ncbi:MAG: DUF3795 domain-containing protein [Huintestinicola sp.]